MRTLLLALALSVAASGVALAQGQAHVNTGCGLGTMLWERKADGSAVFQSFQATTNGTSGTQTFGISSGTSNCTKPSAFVQNDKLINFVQSNMDNLAKEMSMGKGETLDTFVEMMGVPQEQSVIYKAKLQANFDKVFSSDKVEVAQVIDNAYAVANS
ncbi:DUF3015 domain-containing protein [Geomonas sp. RF6]|uniref:DUF3015 family protein n=1 Tax=Geomonas sp. RF6 TaxID=2897342 RepID=UPI001E64251C|nr:DUF3015 family protein [Geomonas sp. RF6]UFS71752.1 DUF3015 domain-containing protein [Geomonas sp. RF6]